MNRISSDCSYRSTVSITIALLLVICGGLFIAGATQGPKLSSVQLDLARASTQQVRLIANQAVTTITTAQVQISPAASFAVETTENVIAVIFTEQLDYATTYTVTIASVRNTTRDNESTFATSFDTADAAVYYLDRNDDSDRIYSSGITATERRVLYESPSIMDFTVVGRVLAVVTRDVDGVDSLVLVQIDSTIVEVLPLPDTGWITQVHASDSALTLGFVLTSIGDADYVRTLFTVHLASDRTLSPTLGLGGSPLHVRDWLFRPGTESLIVLDSSNALSVIDPDRIIDTVPLGDFLTLSHVSEDGSIVTASDQFGFSAITLDSLDTERLSAASVTDSPSHLGGVQSLTDESTLELVFSYFADANRFDSFLLRNHGSTATSLYGEPGGAAMLLRFTVSPNEQYVAIEIDPDTTSTQDDGYVGNSRPTTVSTVVVDIATGALVTTIDGFDFHW